MKDLERKAALETKAGKEILRKRIESDKLVSLFYRIRNCYEFVVIIIAILLAFITMTIWLVNP